MAEQFPFLKTKILKHSDYATKTLQELFPSKVLEASQVKTITYRRSIVAINDGKGTGGLHFSVRDLPAAVQMTCVSAIACDDLNNDGRKDLVLGGNFTHFTPQLGMIDACQGVVLLNQPGGAFRVLSSKESGYLTSGEVKQISPLVINKERYLLNLVNNAAPSLFKRR